MPTNSSTFRGRDQCNLLRAEWRWSSWAKWGGGCECQFTRLCMNVCVGMQSNHLPLPAMWPIHYLLACIINPWTWSEHICVCLCVKDLAELCITWCKNGADWKHFQIHSDFEPCTDRLLCRTSTFVFPDGFNSNAEFWYQESLIKSKVKTLRLIQSWIFKNRCEYNF